MAKKKQTKSFLQLTKHHFRMAVVPHKKNDYRPHLIRRYGIVAIVFVVAGLQFGYNAATTGNVLGRESTVTIGSLLDETNQARTNDGESVLVLNKQLSQAAHLKAQDMFAQQYWAHNAPDGTQPWKWFGDVDYNYARAGENLAKNFTSSNAVVDAWLASPEHKANVLKSDYQDVGFAVVDGVLNNKPTSVVVALYGMPAESAVAGVESKFSNPPMAITMSLIAQFGLALQSISPAALGGLVLIALATGVAITAHSYRRKLPKTLRQSWYRHHGLYKAAGMMSLGVMVVFLSGGGQI
ncbi:hypothetical protein H7X69_02435 [Candidatus Saccharibacteria bacterium]|nr:hypothetical protein [Candidatus Saccharibacteria bacterium]